MTEVYDLVYSIGRGENMNNPVLIKGNKYGISLALNSELEFLELLTIIGEKFKESAKFFDTKQQVAISFEGRQLSTNEIQQILAVIKENCSLDISYVIDNSEQTLEVFQMAVTTKQQDKIVQQPEIMETISAESQLSHSNFDDGRFYKGTLRSGQTIHSNSSIIVIGDVNPGASVIATGNIIVLGCLKGTACAGCDGNEKAFVVALDMLPMQIRIGNVIARASDTARPKKGFFKRNIETETEAKIAYVVKENICIETISKTVLSEVI